MIEQLLKLRGYTLWKVQISQKVKTLEYVCSQIHVIVKNGTYKFVFYGKITLCTEELSDLEQFDTYEKLFKKYVYFGTELCQNT